MKKMLFLVFALANTVVYAQSKKKQIITLNNRVDSFRLALLSEIKLSNENSLKLNNRVDSFRLALSSERQSKLSNEKRDALKISDLNSSIKRKDIVNENLTQQNSALQEKYDELLLKLDNVISVANDTFSKMQKKIELLEQQIAKKKFTHVTQNLPHWWDKVNDYGYRISLNDDRIADEVQYIGALVAFNEAIFFIDGEEIKFGSKQIEQNGSIVKLKFFSSDFSVVMEYDEENVTGAYTEGMIRLVFGGVEQVKTRFVMVGWGF